MRRIATILAIMAALAAGAGLAAAAEHGSNRPPSAVVRPDATGVAAGRPALEGNIAWAIGQAPKTAPGRAFWVGYSIDRLQGEHSHIGSFGPGNAGRDLTVAEILAGKTAPEAAASAGEVVRKAARAALEEIESRGKPEKKIVKELGFFLKYEPGKTPVLSQARPGNLELAFDFEGLTLFWLGKVPEDMSLALVERLYKSARNDDIREDLITVAGCHGTPALVVPVLAAILGGDASDELRKNAAFWIGQQNDAEGLRLLGKTARQDRSEEVREGAVFAISQIELPAAVDEIIALARSAEKRDVRKQAVFWLGQMASEKSGRALEEFARKDADTEIQEQAVFALSQLPDDQGVDALIKLAKAHPDPRIRKKAVFWLGECNDPRALETLIGIVKGK
jgi:HEAT repeat protein